MREFNKESLAEFNGKDGKPVYVAHKGKVFDVSTSRFWKTGAHMKRHPSGKDLTTEIQLAPHGPEVLERFPQIGSLKPEKEPIRPLPHWLAHLLDRLPVLQRHPHPMIVHFPIVLSILPTLFILLYLLTGVRSFEITAFHCLGAAIIFIPMGIVTGFFTWWLNYQAKPMKAVRVKIILSHLLLGLVVAIFCWRLASPDVILSLAGSGFIYFLLTLSLIPVVSVVGWYGAKLTFPMEENSVN
jgi:predicted heme/steroid binding protein/uncharacterized membrane protein